LIKKDEEWYNIKALGGVSGRRRLLSTDIEGLMIDLRSRDSGNGRQQWVLSGFVPPDERRHRAPAKRYDMHGRVMTKAECAENRKKHGKDPESEEDAPKIKITVLEEGDAKLLLDPLHSGERGTMQKLGRTLCHIENAANTLHADASKNWWEFRTKCQQKLADRPNHLPTCKCGKDKVVGATASAPICRRCGFMCVHEVPREDCGWKDLSELVWPLLEGASQSSHSEQQAALRAAGQFLRSRPPPWEWSGPESSPLKCAVLCGRADLAYLLIEASAPVNEKDEEGISVLHWAVDGCQENMCRMLLDMSADANIVDQLGQTPLFFAPNTRICTVLLDGQADINIVNQKGQSALDLVSQAGLNEVFNYLSEVAKSNPRSRNDARSNNRWQSQAPR